MVKNSFRITCKRILAASVSKQNVKLKQGWHLRILHMFNSGKPFSSNSPFLTVKHHLSLKIIILAKYLTIWV